MLQAIALLSIVYGWIITPSSYGIQILPQEGNSWTNLPTDGVLNVDMPILTCIFFTSNWLTLTSEMHFVKFHPVVASCLLSRGKRKYAPLGMRLLWKYIRNYFPVYHLISQFLLYLQNYKEFEAEILDLQSEKYGLSFDIKKYTTSGWALGDENVIGIRAFKICYATSIQRCIFNSSSLPHLHYDFHQIIDCS